MVPNRQRINMARRTVCKADLKTSQLLMLGTEVATYGVNAEDPSSSWGEFMTAAAKIICEMV